MYYGRMSISVAVAGASGYAGSEILRLLVGHPAYHSGELTIGALTAHSSAGQRFGSVAPHIPQLADRVIEDTTAEVLGRHDVVFLGLPHGHSAAIAQQLSEDTVIIDCAADFRLRDAKAWQHYYGSAHAGSWPYGIPEMPGHREAIKNSRHIAVPGCFPTGATLAMYPAVNAGLVIPEVTVTSVTGVSGAGKKASVDMLGSETMGSLKAYKVGGTHRHTPEMIQNFQEFTQEPVSVTFTPVLAPLSRGILTTATAKLRGSVSEAQIREAYTRAYKDEPCVMFLPEGQQPQTQNVVGANVCQVQVAVNPGGRQLVATSAIDNLTKGTGGAAVQCMNLVLGWEETAGLPLAAVAP